MRRLGLLLHVPQQLLQLQLLLLLLQLLLQLKAQHHNRCVVGRLRAQFECRFVPLSVLATRPADRQAHVTLDAFHSRRRRKLTRLPLSAVDARHASRPQKVDWGRLGRRKSSGVDSSELN